jgi:hypothetical protein
MLYIIMYISERRVIISHLLNEFLNDTFVL